MSKLFTTLKLGNITLNNRIAMAPMTRSRAINSIPNELHVEYYRKRATAGLLITEGTAPSPNGLGYARIPGIFNDAQVKAWKKVTDAVHEQGGKIFVQLMHTGRVSHPANMPAGAVVLAPSAVKMNETKMWVDDQGMLDIPTPSAMTAEDIEDTIHEHVIAAENAIRAGFDGVELHAANGYLLKQFINPFTNQRTDEYGGSIENRSRFLLEVAERVIAAIGKEKVGVRISPYSTFNETPAYAETDATYEYIAKKLNELGVVYLHINDPEGKGAASNLSKKIRSLFNNTIILAGGFDKAKAEESLLNNEADLIALGRPFIPNPDLVERYKNNLPLNQPKYDLFYTAGAQGYVDYPVFEEVPVI